MENGEGLLRGKHIYYRCTNRVKNFPLPRTCAEKGVNARIADTLVWQKIAELMSSPELLVKQVEYWLNNQNDRTQTSAINVEETKKEIAKLKDQEDRYAKAYGAGVISIGQLKEYTLPLKEKTSAFEDQVAKAQLESDQVDETVLPKSDEIVSFAQEAAQTLPGLNFEAKKEIVRDTVDKVVATQKELHVFGYIPVTNINVFPLHRHRRASECGQINAV